MQEPLRGEQPMDDNQKQPESSELLMMPWLMISQQLQGVERSLNQRIDDLKDDVRELKDDFRALREETQREIQTTKNDIQTTKIELSNRLEKVETLSEKFISRVNVYGVLISVLLAAIGVIIALRL